MARRRHWKTLTPLMLALSSCPQSPAEDARGDADVESHADDAREGEVSDRGEAEAEHEVSDSAADAGDCWGEPIRCGGSRCCSPESLSAYLAAHPLPADMPTYSSLAARAMFRVDESNVGFLPALRGWSWRADGSEIVLVAGMWSPRCWAQCFNWCFPIDRDLVVVVDVETDEVAHREFLTSPFDWAVHFDRAGRECPASLASRDPFSCLWVEVSERGVGYNTYGGYIGYRDDEETFIHDPVLRGMIRAYPVPLPDPLPDPAPRAIDVRIPEVLDWVRVCDTADPGDAAP